MLRSIKAIVIYESELPLAEGSAIDKFFNWSFKDSDGSQLVCDSILAVVCGQLGQDEAITALKQYSGSEISVEVVLSHDDVGNEIEDDEVNEEIGHVVERWLYSRHPGAIFKIDQGHHEMLNLWWSGIEEIDGEFGIAEAFSTTLPASHHSKAKTWLAILNEQFQFEEGEIAVEYEFTLRAAALCAWLHGFEAASGNNSNLFEPETVCKELRIDDFFLGFLMGQQDAENSFESYVAESEAYEPTDLRDFALKELTAGMRLKIRDCLIDYFGSDSALFCALYFAIWPNYSKPLVEASNTLLGTSHYDELGELIPAWQFVTDGWCDEADS